MFVKDMLQMLAKGIEKIYELKEKIFRLLFDSFKKSSKLRGAKLSIITLMIHLHAVEVISVQKLQRLEVALLFFTDWFWYFYRFYL